MSDEERKLRATSHGKSVPLEASCWYMDDKVCPQCGSAVATDGRRQWCVSTKCDWETYRPNGDSVTKEST